MGGEVTCVGEETFNAEGVAAVCEVPGTGLGVVWYVSPWLFCRIYTLIPGYIGGTKNSIPTWRLGFHKRAK